MEEKCIEQLKLPESIITKFKLKLMKCMPEATTINVYKSHLELTCEQKKAFLGHPIAYFIIND